MEKTKEDKTLWIKVTPNMAIWPEDQKITLTDEEIFELEAVMASRPTPPPYQPSEAVLKHSKRQSEEE